MQPQLSTVALYVRLATQALGEPDSTTQLEALRACAAGEGLTVVDSYADQPSAGDFPLEERPEGARLLTDAQRGCFGRVLVSSLDELAHETKAVIAIQVALAAAGCRIAVMEKERAFDTRVRDEGRGLTFIAHYPVKQTEEERQRCVDALVMLLERSINRSPHLPLSAEEGTPS